MDWQDEVRGRLAKKNQILFGKDSPYLRDLDALFRGQSHRTMVLWALDLAEGSVLELEAAYPGERRPREALEAARDWAAGKIKMREAQRKILDCHGLAREVSSPADAAVCHAIGQACSVVHTAGHAMGYPIYDLTAIVYRLGLGNCREQVERRKEEYVDRLLWWAGRPEKDAGEWAGFLGG